MPRAVMLLSCLAGSALGFGTAPSDAPPPGCYDLSHGDMLHEDGSNIYMIPGCQCHHTCHHCGFYEWPSDETDCVTCGHGEEPFEKVTSVWDDGTGYCGRRRKLSAMNKEKKVASKEAIDAFKALF